ncbi:hypothetical protein CS542_04585 [Pedobacter sp. IW39]|nr:hypothetical protein CS542_04585 [Pedobacter sp. IW39]
MDLGHKAVAAENLLKEGLFLNAPTAEAVSQSEEHLVLELGSGHGFGSGISCMVYQYISVLQ